MMKAHDYDDDDDDDYAFQYRNNEINCYIEWDIIYVLQKNWLFILC